MQFKVPQDVQRADKIVGPLTMRQLIISAIGGGMCYSLYLILSKQYILEIWLPPIVFISVITVAFAFFRFHDLPFEKVVLYFIEYKFKPQKRTFQKMRGDVIISVLQPIKKEKTDSAAKAKESKDQEKLKKLAELTSKIDTRGREMLAKKLSQK